MDNGTALEIFHKGIEYARRTSDNEVTASNKRQLKEGALWHNTWDLCLLMAEDYK